MKELLNGRNGSPLVNGHNSAALPAAKAAAILMSLVRDLLYVDDPTSNLPVRQLRVCGLLYEAPRTMSDLGRELHVSQSAMTQIADRLERAGLVIRESNDEDRRVKCLKLTPRGQRAMREREGVRAARMAVVFERLSAEEQRSVVSALEAIQEASAPATE